MIRTTGVGYSVGSFRLEDFSLEVAPGEYFVLLGPPGAGKTVVLECLGGLNRVERGRIDLEGRDVTHLEPRERAVGYVPQDYALFPHLPVAGNIQFGLRSRGLDRRARWERTWRVAELLKVTHLLDRKPDTLSGGERQRVALARALAIEPRVFLLDEPVSSLDERTREETCRELGSIHRAASATTLHVCHNFAEMLAVADRAGVMQDGRLVQVGRPREILERPRNRFVAEFVQARNIVSARASPADGGALIETAGGNTLRTSTPACGAVEFTVRPERIRLANAPALPSAASDTDVNVLPATVTRVDDQGVLVQITIRCRDGLLLVAALGHNEHRLLNARPRDHVAASFEPEDVHILESCVPRNAGSANDTSRIGS